jgi:hypothetical protein
MKKVASIYVFGQRPKAAWVLCPNGQCPLGHCPSRKAKAKNRRFLNRRMFIKEFAFSLEGAQ